MNWPSRLRFFVWLALVALGLQVWIRASLEPPALPEQAPDFALVGLDGQPLALADLRGQPALLNFWATWCAPCRDEAPALARFQATHPQVQLVGLALDGSDDALRATADAWGMTWPVARIDAETRDAYQIDAVPMTVLVGPGGEVVEVWMGAVTEAALEVGLRAVGGGDFGD